VADLDLLSTYILHWLRLRELELGGGPEFRLLRAVEHSIMYITCCLRQSAVVAAHAEKQRQDRRFEVGSLSLPGYRYGRLGISPSR
jgi:hypothetical protein